MNTHTLLLLLLLAPALTAGAQELPDRQAAGIRVSRPAIERDGTRARVSLAMRLDSLRVGSARAALFTPCLETDEQQVALRTVGVYGRRRHIDYVRRGEGLLTDGPESTLRARHLPAVLDYEAETPWQDWMAGARLVLRRTDYGCCGTILAQSAEALISPCAKEPEPALPPLRYVRPQASASKTGAVRKVARILFPVGRTEIRPDLKNNARELADILATIDSVRSDADCRITSLTVHGYASPEGSYQSNERLASGRTEALCQHIRRASGLDPLTFTTGWNAEDWKGTRDYVAASTLLPHRAEILSIIDSDREPDDKDHLIRQLYPTDYALLLSDCYPALRRTDYTVGYTIRQYADIGEIRRVYHDKPQKLSLNELYLLAQTMEEGSEEFDEIFDLAVRLFPDDPVANINAANAAMHRGRLDLADRYLRHAGTSPDADYARQALEARQRQAADKREATPF